jgi:uncharacterized protein
MARRESTTRRQLASPAPKVPPAAATETLPPLRVEGGRLLVRVQVSPRSGRESLALEHGELRAWLMAPPVDGAANEALLALFAARLRVPRRAVALVRGATARRKVLAIDGLDAATFWQRLRLTPQEGGR